MFRVQFFQYHLLLCFISSILSHLGQNESHFPFLLLDTVLNVITFKISVGYHNMIQFSVVRPYQCPLSKYKVVSLLKAWLLGLNVFFI